jgi:3-hydroxybutyryl-CoA dehydrogenase
VVTSWVTGVVTDGVVTSVGVVGGGTMGVGIAYVFAAAGCPTTVVEPDDARAAALRTEIADAAAQGVRRGKLDEAGATALAGRITRVADVAELPTGLGLVVETVPERLDLKHRVLAAIEARGPGLVASNTSALPIGELAGALQRPGRFLGMHFFNPVWSIGLVEIIRGAQTEAGAVADARAAAALIGKESIVVGDVPGFATSRLDVNTALEAMRMLESGVASAEDIDRAAELAYRHPMGPLRLSDVVGLDVRLDIARNLAEAYGPRFEPPQILIDKVAAGELGRKSGVGFYRWDT